MTKGSAFTTITTLLSYTVLTFFGVLRDFFGRLTGSSRYAGDLGGFSSNRSQGNISPDATFYQRRLFDRIKDCWNRPIQSPPAAIIKVMERRSNDGRRLFVPEDHETIEALNLGSYNYLGFADNWMETCGKEVLSEGYYHYGPVSCSSPSEAGTFKVQVELEKKIASFLGKDDAVVFSMGYGTNADALSTLIDSDTLVISDGLNHTSIVNGCRATRTTVVPFKHNNIKDLERTLKFGIACGRYFDYSKSDFPKGFEFVPWKKILVVVEGLYSMEGEVCKLKEVVKLCKQYKAYLYVDEAHSIGALGDTGRGVCEYAGVDTKDVDILMGTFSKSFGGMGGYIAGNKDLIDSLRINASSFLQGNALSPTVCCQILTSFNLISGREKDKLRRLRENSKFFRRGLKKIGVGVLGEEASPVVPVMLYYPSKIPAFSREMLKLGVAVVVVGYPAVPIYESRVRFCLSAAHTKEQLKDVLKKVEKVSRMLNIRYAKSSLG